MTVALALSSSLGLAACTSHVTVAPSELPALSNASPGPSGPFPTITTKSGARKVVYGHLQTVTVQRKEGAPLVYPAPIRSLLRSDRLVVRTRDDAREIPLAEITEVQASYDDYLVRDRVAGGVLLGTGMPIFVGGVVTGALGLTKDLDTGAGVVLSLSGLGIAGIGLLMMIPGMVLAKGGPKKPAPEPGKTVTVSIGAGGISGSF
ncbi:hypothetical protein KEG38_54500 [Polyangium jinanense]|uniref:hypothetical protein n=1 Tax=Polyangium jinanense TaxID=2829994 RepID=UPI0023425E88|nr:hypothetical protein [Polyangium jinanense]MDC3962935.1 hypothetical protein [Polyangium jinanense]